MDTSRPLQDLDGRTAIVTGAASGIGRAIAQELRAHRVRVGGIDLQDSDECDASVTADVGDADALRAAVATLAEQLGPPTLAVHSAGIARDAVHWKLSLDDWNDVLRVNLTGAFLLLRELTPHIRKESGGALVFVSSINGARGKFGQSAYAASKAGLVGLARSAARELGRFGGRINIVSPGMVETPMTSGLAQEWHDRAAAESALGRIAAPEEIACAVRFLLSGHARHITGQDLSVDGGQAMR
jgi:3-oxoacyl-[acyl-carrier protein] reductase